MQMLSIFGYPQDIKTDNGSPFNSNSFAHFASYSGFTHRRITPRWPRANAQTESFNKPLMKAVRAATVEGKCWKQELHKFLRQCRATPHPSTGFSPYHLMFGRASQRRLPQVAPPTKETETEHEARRNDNRVKINMKRYADARKHATSCDLKVGDTVLVKNEKRLNKLALARVQAQGKNSGPASKARYFVLSPFAHEHGTLIGCFCWIL